MSIEQSLQLPSDSDPNAQAILRHLSACNIHLQKGDAVVAKEHANLALELIQKTGQTHYLPLTMEYLCQSNQAAGDLEAALVLSRQVLAIAREVKDRETEALKLIGIAMILREMNRTDEAIVYYEEALILCKKLDNQKIAGLCQMWLGHAQVAAKKVMEGMRNMGEAMLHMTESGEEQGAAMAKVRLGSLFRLVEETDFAEDLLEEAIPVLKGAGDYSLALKALRELEAIFVEEEDASEALIDVLKEQVEVTVAWGKKEEQLKVLHNLAQTYARLGEVGQAAGTYAECLALAKQIGDRMMEATALWEIGNASTDRAAKKRAFTQALPLLQSLDPLGARVAHVSLDLAEIAVKEGNAEDALLHLRLGLDTCGNFREDHPLSKRGFEVALKVYRFAGKEDQAKRCSELLDQLVYREAVRKRRQVIEVIDAEEHKMRRSKAPYEERN